MNSLSPIITRHGTTDYPNAIRRLASFPLDESSVFTSYTDAIEYAASNKTAYELQVITAPDADGNPKIFILTKNTDSNTINFDLYDVIADILSKDKVIRAGKYDSTTNKIYLDINPDRTVTLYSDTTYVIEIPVADLINEVILFGSAAINVTLDTSDSSHDKKYTISLILSTYNDNNLVINTDGLYSRDKHHYIEINQNSEVSIGTYNSKTAINITKNNYNDTRTSEWTEDLIYLKFNLATSLSAYSNISALTSVKYICFNSIIFELPDHVSGSNLLNTMSIYAIYGTNKVEPIIICDVPYADYNMYITEY